MDKTLEKVKISNGGGMGRKGAKERPWVSRQVWPVKGLRENGCRHIL